MNKWGNKACCYCCCLVIQNCSEAFYSLHRISLEIKNFRAVFRVFPGSKITFFYTDFSESRGPGSSPDRVTVLCSSHPGGVH